MSLSLSLPVPTSLNALYSNQYSFNSRTKKREPTGARVLSAEGKKSKSLIQKAARTQLKQYNKECEKNNLPQWDYEKTKDNFMYMDITFYWNRASRDDNNAFKLLHDSLEKIIYENDSKILTRTQRMYIDSKNPRLEIKFSYVEYIGVFDDQSTLDKFESACKGCSRYARNCSLLVKAKEGRVQEEIDNDLVCSKFKTKK